LKREKILEGFATRFDVKAGKAAGGVVIKLDFKGHEQEV
jgi:hypothetical protein